MYPAARETPPRIGNHLGRRDFADEVLVPPATAVGIAAHIVGDREQPRQQRLPDIDRGSPAPGLHERLGGGVFSQRPDAYAPEAVVVHAIRMPNKQLSERRGVASAGPRPEPRVRGFAVVGRHALLCPAGPSKFHKRSGV